MAKTKEQKKEVIEDIREKIDRQKAIVFIDIKGLKTKDIFSLRETLKKENCLLTIAKKTLFKIAFKEKKQEIDFQKIEGQIGLVFGFEDETAPARIVNQFSLKNENLKILAGFFDKKFIDKEKIMLLANISSKKEIFAKVVGSISAPIVNFLNIFQGNLKNLVYLLSSIKK